MQIAYNKDIMLRKKSESHNRTPLVSNLNTNQLNHIIKKHLKLVTVTKGKVHARGIIYLQNKIALITF